MDITTFAAIGGALLLVSLAVDVFLAIFHYDHCGLFLGHLHHFIWKTLLIFSRIFPKLRRSVLVLAGPLMMLASFVLWITLFIFGFALVFWPWMDGSFRADSEIQSLGFIEALYFSGSTGTVLGYGDITPLSPFMKILSIIESGLGFALLTSIVTYLLQVMNGVSERNALALKLKVESEKYGNGALAIRRQLEQEGLDTTIIPFKLTLYQLQTLQEKLHQFPILDLYYRSLQKWRDPEMLFLLLFETSVGMRLAAGNGRGGLRFIADSLEACLERLMAGMENESFKGTSVKDVKDRDMAAKSLQEFQEAMGTKSSTKDNEVGEHVLRLIERYQNFMLKAERITNWKKDQSDRKSPLFPKMRANNRRSYETKQKENSLFN